MRCSIPLSKEEINEATHKQVCIWYRFLPVAIPLQWKGTADDYTDIKCWVYDRLQELGGFTPEISKEIGWDGDD